MREFVWKAGSVMRLPILLRRWSTATLLISVMALAACGPDLPLFNTAADLYISGITLTDAHAGWAIGVQPGQKRAVLLRESDGAWQQDPAAPPFAQGESPKTLAVDGTVLVIGGSFTDAAHGDATQTSGFTYMRTGNGPWQRTQLNHSVNAVTLLGAEEGWAVGAGGAIYHYLAGVWRQVPDEMDFDLFSLAFRSPTNGWAVGDQGAFLQFDGTAWHHIAHLTHEILYGIAVSADDGWVVGTNGVTIRWSNGQWYEFTAPINTTNRAVTLIDGNAWVVGDHGAVFEYTVADQQWHHIAPPDDVQLNTVAVTPSGSAWMGGDASQTHLFDYAQGRWQTMPVTLAK